MLKMELYSEDEIIDELIEIYGEDITLKELSVFLKERREVEYSEE